MGATRELLMEPALASGQDELRGLRLDLLRRATEMYLVLAYPSGQVPEVVRRRLVWRDDCAADELLCAPPSSARARHPGGRRRFTHCGWATIAIRT